LKGFSAESAICGWTQVSALTAAAIRETRTNPLSRFCNVVIIGLFSSFESRSQP
jgi:hypothetical protein